MIISHSHKFIFIKTMKTAGTSLELAFAQACGAQDIVARIRPPEPSLEARDDIRFGNAHFRHRKTDASLILRQHSPLSRAVQALGPGIADYAIVTSERNPWRKLVSSFFWKLKDTPEQILGDAPRPEDPEALQALFRHFVLSPVPDPSDAFDMYSHAGIVLADHVIRFEHLAEDLAETARALDLPPGVRLPEKPAKGGIAPAVSQLHFDAEMDATVRRRFAREIVWFGYDGPDATGAPYRPHSAIAQWRQAFETRYAESGWVPKRKG
ncbi:sulfotransferase family 2 domain-containing protein [Celeribacter neptunius]|uniref:Sulfotransferase family protein n=1 Tax=Celeribacter neptunius TaxID=588602 RepID=A0A1I3QMQ9_9RHOB|nr:sulfotransferase family 2 domain-containing protein [Celeribacter neptunius]SFJ34506.1 hypothetical protein SAMN04487991_1872 [Celeribacter neptunius]